jgi:hypothetical protein
MPATGEPVSGGMDGPGSFKDLIFAFVVLSRLNRCRQQFAAGPGLSGHTPGDRFLKRLKLAPKKG